MNKKLSFFIFASIMFCVFNVDANAEQYTPDGVMRMLSASTMNGVEPIACEPRYVQREQKEFIAKIKNGDFLDGGTEARLDAIDAAICAVQMNAIPMDIAEQIAGEDLSESVIALHRAGLDTPERLADARNAMTLLKVNAEKNYNLISALESSGVFPKAPPVASTDASFEMMAADAASQLMANSFAFDHKYGGKTLKITGKITSITGGSGVFITMEGVPDPDPSIEDQVTCTISNPSYMSAAISVRKGQRITVQGAYPSPSSSQLSMQSGVALQDCRIVN